MPLMFSNSSLMLPAKLGELFGLLLITETPEMENPSLCTDEDSDRFSLES